MSYFIHMVKEGLSEDFSLYLNDQRLAKAVSVQDGGLFFKGMEREMFCSRGFFQVFSPPHMVTSIEDFLDIFFSN